MFSESPVLIKTLKSDHDITFKAMFNLKLVADIHPIGTFNAKMV